MADYRWGKASGGAVPEGAPAEGHGYFRIPEDETRHPLWAIRSLPGADGSVRLGHVGSANGAVVGETEDEQGENVDEYEVLLDEGTWAPSEADDLGAAGAQACGRLADSTPVYFSLGDPWGEGADAPLETQAQNDWQHARQVLMAPTGAEASATPAAPGDAPGADGYRWVRASGGEIPAGVPEKGHGWRWGTDENGDDVGVPQWLARSLPDADGAVRLGRVERGQPAQIGAFRSEQPHDDYEVLVDEGTWAYPGLTDDDNLDLVGAGGLACGRLADGTPLYGIVRDREGEGEEPGESPGVQPMDFNRKVLVAPAGSAAAAPAAQPAAPAAADEPAAAEPAAEEPAAASVVVRALDLRGEVVEIANSGAAPIDIGGWKLHDEGSTKGFVFPSGTVLEAGASVRVRSGPGAATTGPGELKWKTTSVWNDKGDTAYLKDPGGELVSSKKG